MKANTDQAKLIWSTRKKPIELPERPFRTVEIIDDDTGKQTGRDTPPYNWHNKLIRGDNRQIMSSISKQTWGRDVRLIYLDPPFFTGSNFSLSTSFVNGKDNTPYTIQAPAYRDTWKDGISSYLQFMYERLCLVRDLLTDNGSLYLHCDWHVGHYLKVMLDEIFGYENFRNEIVWFYPDTPGRTKRYFNSKHDVIFWYSKGKSFIFNADQVREEILPESKARYKSPRVLGGRSYLGGKSATIGKVPEDVWRIPSVKGTTVEKMRYETQKPELLLKRIILASSNPGDLVADFFCGSGTTAAVAEKLGRRWITSDLSERSIQITRKRILNIHRSHDLFDSKRKKLYHRPAKRFEVLIQEGIKKQREDNSASGQTVCPAQDEPGSSSESPALELKTTVSNNDLFLSLTGFTPILIPKGKGPNIEVDDSKKLLDYWAVDWNHSGNIFHNHWRSFRMPKRPDMDFTASHRYDTSGEYRIMVKAMDVFGRVITREMDVVIS
ncbi:MAG: site-specific DNA-methyltransferase [bacterium]|nr:site-specific DNA-methyltransferase [bacterium]